MVVLAQLASGGKVLAVAPPRQPQRMTIAFYFGSPWPQGWPSCVDAAPTIHTLASHRLRATLPALELSRRGYRVVVVVTPTELKTTLGGSGARSWLIISKLSHPDAADFEQMLDGAFALIAEARQLGVGVMVDYTDDLVACGDHRSRRTLELLLAADTITCASEYLVCRVGLYTGDPTSVALLADPLEGDRPQPPPVREVEGAPLRLLWFGHFANLDALLHWLMPLHELSTSHPLALEIVTRISDEQLLELQFGILSAGLAFTITFTQWEDPSSTLVALRRSTVAFLPIDLKGTKAGVSSNRLTESLWGGCYVVASPASSYLPFQGRGAWLGDSLVEGLKWFVDNRQEAAKQVMDAQVSLASSYTIQRVADQWEQLLSCHPCRITPQVDIRINLGCGNHLLDGYLNIDIASERAGVRPDLVCDVADLSLLPESYASEILSVHVIEHLWRWEVENILREWIRVLRPGGKLIVECPNLLSACEALLADPVQSSAPDQRGQRTMWVLYGDPSWQDPLMCHRWAYTPQSLAELLFGVGLISVRQEAAMYKLREPRDMRVTGVKP